jgi:hypothetical protein
MKSNSSWKVDFQPLPMDWYIYPLVVGAGFIAGFINTLAGSGSLVSLPMLIFAGLPSPIANGTNRVGILLQNMVGAQRFHQQEMLDIKGTLYLGLPAVIGSIVGAQIATDINEAVMDKVIGGNMVLMLFVIILKPKQWLRGELQSLEKFPSIWMLLLFFGIGVYGGFIQAGVGIFLLSGLVLGAGYDLVRGNAVKVGINLLFTVFALAVFWFNGQVNLLLGLVLAVGNMFGAWFAAQIAIDKGAQWVRGFLILIVVISAVNLLGLFSWIGELL